MNPTVEYTNIEHRAVEYLSDYLNNYLSLKSYNIDPDADELKLIENESYCKFILNENDANSKIFTKNVEKFLKEMEEKQTKQELSRGDLSL